MRAFLVLAHTAQQGGALGDHLLILAERAAVGRMHLAERQIEEAAPLGGRADDQIEVGGREDDDRHLPQQVHRAARPRR